MHFIWWLERHEVVIISYPYSMILFLSFSVYSSHFPPRQTTLTPLVEFCIKYSFSFIIIDWSSIDCLIFVCLLMWKQRCSLSGNRPATRSPTRLLPSCCRRPTYSCAAISRLPLPQAPLSPPPDRMSHHQVLLRKEKKGHHSKTAATVFASSSYPLRHCGKPLGNFRSFLGDFLFFSFFFLL